MRLLIALAGLAALVGCQQPAPPAPTPEPAPQTAPAPPPAPTGWTVTDGEPMTLRFTEGDTEIAVACPEAKKELRISFAPAWEAPGGVAPDASRVTVLIGTMAFDAKADAESLKAAPGAPVYVLKATPDNVTALMTSSNLGLRLKDGAQEVIGTPTDTGAFDTFATTCAQINGLK